MSLTGEFTVGACAAGVGGSCTGAAGVGGCCSAGIGGAAAALVIQRGSVGTATAADLGIAAGAGAVADAGAIRPTSCRTPGANVAASNRACAAESSDCDCGTARSDETAATNRNATIDTNDTTLNPAR